MSATAIGALALGAVMGYVTHYLLRRDPNAGLHDLAGIVASLAGGVALGAVGGADRAGPYMAGIGLGFFLYWLALMAGREPGQPDLGSDGRRGRRLFPFLGRSSGSNRHAAGGSGAETRLWASSARPIMRAWGGRTRLSPRSAPPQLRESEGGRGDPTGRPALRIRGPTTCSSPS